MILPFTKKLESLLKTTLPGKQAQLQMIPTISGPQQYRSSISDRTKQGGVLILLYPDGEQISFPLMLRHVYKGAHSGQVSLPGGKKEDFDEDIVATALRESEEEIGVGKDGVTVIGRLTELYIYASDFLVTPIVGYTEEKPHFKPDTYEVKELILTNLKELLEEANLKRKEVSFNEGKGRINAPYFDISGHVVWGATAMMLSEFKTLLKMMR